MRATRGCFCKQLSSLHSSERLEINIADQQRYSKPSFIALTGLCFIVQDLKTRRIEFRAMTDKSSKLMSCSLVTEHANFDLGRNVKGKGPTYELQ